MCVEREVKLKELTGKVRRRKDKVESFLDYLRVNTDFFTAPASSKYHSAFRGGLLHHSILVTEKMLEVNKALQADLSEESIVIVGLFHDVGKVNTYFEYGEKYIRVDKGMPHEVISLVMTSRFIPLTPDEAHAILYHNGLYTPLGKELIGKERPLTLLLHFVDLWCSRFEETRADEEGEE